MTLPTSQTGLPPVTQEVVQALTNAAIFLVVTINPGGANRGAVRSFCGDLPALLRAVGFRDIEGDLSCVMGIGSDAWDRLFGRPRPAELHPFREIRPARAMPSRRPAISCSTFAPSAWISVSSWRRRSWRGSATRFRRSTKCTVSLFRRARSPRLCRRHGEPDGASRDRRRLYRGRRRGLRRRQLCHRAEYLHDLAGWNALPTEAQERIIGRTKLSDIELDDAVKPTSAHNALTTIAEDGKEIKILRDNMPFGRAWPRGVRHLLHRLRPLATNDRADAGEHVRRPSAGQLRSVARFQLREDGQSVLRAVRDFPGKRRGRRSPPGESCRTRHAARRQSPARNATVRSVSVR